MDIHRGPFILLAVAGVVLLAAVIALVAARAARRRGHARTTANPARAPSRAQPAAPAKDAAAGAPAAARGDAMAELVALERDLARESSHLWAQALGAAPGVSSAMPTAAVPAGHEAIVAAAGEALAAATLAERHFPRRPMLMPQLLAAVNDPEAPPMKLASIIGQDPVLTGNILRLANSVFFRVSSKPVESIQRAVIVCGTDGLQALAAAALVQPVFRGGSAAHSGFPAVLWERGTRAAIAAELCARHWCLVDRQAAQLLGLLSALGPLVVYRIVEDQYRQHAGLSPAPTVFLRMIDAHGVAMGARIATLWQSPTRIVAVLAGATGGSAALSPDDVALARALRAGELLATLSLLAADGRVNEGECGALALSAGIPMPLFATVWARLHPAPDEEPTATQVA